MPIFEKTQDVLPTHRSGETVATATVLEITHAPIAKGIHRCVGGCSVGQRLRKTMSQTEAPSHGVVPRRGDAPKTQTVLGDSGHSVYERGF